MTAPWTVGVEQEFLLVDPGTRRPVPPADSVAQHAGAGHDVQRELTPFRIEVAAPVCGTTEEPAEQVVGGRLHLAKAAHAAGARLMASAIPPIGTLGPPPRTGDLVPARDRAAELVSWCAGALDDASALSTVEGHLAWSVAQGRGAPAPGFRRFAGRARAGRPDLGRNGRRCPLRSTVEDSTPRRRR
ncbi:glutamate-cysteine ligase family protein [Actinosynnema sp. CA-299493]